GGRHAPPCQVLVQLRCPTQVSAVGPENRDDVVVAQFETGQLSRQEVRRNGDDHDAFESPFVLDASGELDRPVVGAPAKDRCADVKLVAKAGLLMDLEMFAVAEKYVRGGAEA